MLTQSPRPSVTDTSHTHTHTYTHRTHQTKGFGYVCPRPPPDLTIGVPVLDLDSSYVKRHLKDMPKQVCTGIWRI